MGRCLLLATTAEVEFKLLRNYLQLVAQDLRQELQLQSGCDTERPSVQLLRDSHHDC
jgi:hypothetical protein